MLSFVRRGGTRHLGYHASILAVNAVVSASLLLGLAGKDAVNPGDQLYPDRVPGYAPRQHRVAVNAYQDVQSASLNWTLFSKDAVNPGDQRFPDRYPGTLPAQQRRAIGADEEVRGASVLLTLAAAPGQQLAPDRLPGTRAAQHRAALSTDEVQPSLQGTLLAVAPETPVLGATHPDRFRPQPRPSFDAPNPLPLLLSAVQPTPVTPYDQPNPAPKRPNLELRTHALNLGLSTLAGQDARNPGAALYPDRVPGTAPRQARVAITDQPLDLQGTLLFVVPPVPFVPIDFPLPPPRRPNLELRTHALALVNGVLLGQDAIASRAGREVDESHDPAVTRRAHRSVGLGALRASLAWLEVRPASPLWTLAGQDSVYAGPGQVPPYTWPVPRYQGEIRKHERAGHIGPLGVPFPIINAQSLLETPWATLGAPARGTLSAPVRGTILAPDRDQTLEVP